MSSFEALADCHSTAQRDYSYDRYVDDEMGVDVQDDCISIQQFKLRNPPTVEPPKTSADSALNYPIIGAVAAMDYKCPVCPDPTKKFILSLIVGAERVMDDGKCYEPFTGKNIVVNREGEALFKHLGIVRLSDQARLAIYKSIADVITELFQDFHIPADIQHLIDLLKSGRKRVLYRIHPSVLLHSDRGWVFLKAYEETYGYAKEAYDEVPPVDHFGNPLAWSENAKKIQSAKKFMDFLRNGTSHRLQRSIRLSADQYETLLLVLFHMLLPKLLEAMYDHLGADGLRNAGLLR